MSETSRAVSSPHILRRARTLRAAGMAVEAALLFTITASLLDSGRLPAIRVAVAAGTGLAILLLLLRAAGVIVVRGALGRSRFAFHSSGRWLVLDPRRDDARVGWGVDLAAPLVPRGALSLPGSAVALWLVVRSLAGAADSASAVGALGALAVHQVAAAVLLHRGAEGRLRALVGGLGLVLGLTILLPLGLGPSGLDGARQGGGALGPFPSREALIAGLLLLVPLSLSALEARGQVSRMPQEGAASPARGGSHRARPGVLLGTAFPAFTMTLALLSHAPGEGLVGLAAALGIAAVGRRRGQVPLWVLGLALSVAGMGAALDLGPRPVSGVSAVATLHGELGSVGFLLVAWGALAALGTLRSRPAVLAALIGPLVYGLFAPVAAFNQVWPLLVTAAAFGAPSQPRQAT